MNLKYGNSLAICRGLANAISILSYGLKGQINLAQGNALGKRNSNPSPEGAK
jgi:hypothetical protein